MKRRTATIVTLGVALAGLAGPAAAAGSGPPQPIPTRPIYLALGDSVATGQYSDPPQNDLKAYWRTIAAYKRDGYVAPFAQFLKHEVNCLPATAAPETCGNLQLVSYARSAVPETTPGAGDEKPGVTTQLLIDEQLSPAVKLLTTRNKPGGDPGDDVKVITLTVGGNEIFDAFRTGDGAVIGAAIGTFAGNYAHILGTLRQAGGPGVKILTMTYFNPLRYCSPLPLPPGVTREQVAAQADGVLEALPIPLGEPLGTASGFNGVIETLSTAFGAETAETFGALGEGDFFDCKHPDTSGYQKILAAFEAAWDATD